MKYLCYEISVAATYSTARKKLKYNSVTIRQSTDQPVYEYPPSKYNAEHIIKILLTAKEEQICRSKPRMITRSATFVVDIRCLENQEDIKKDEFGIWNYSGSHPQVFTVNCKEDGYISVEKCESGARGKSVMYLRRLHCTHPSNVEFKRLICFLSGYYYFMYYFESEV